MPRFGKKTVRSIMMNGFWSYQDPNNHLAYLATSRLKTTYQAIPAARYEIIDSMTLYVTGVLLALDT